ncbi:MAG: O-antigen ligase family protein, partial [bacterium]
GLLVSFGVSGLTSINPHLSLFGTYYRMEGLYTFLAYLAFYPVVATTFLTQVQVRRLLAAFVLASALCGLIAIFQVLGVPFGPRMPDDHRVVSTLGNSNFAGQLFAIGGLLSFGLLLHYRRAWVKILCLAAFGLNLFALLETYTRGAWVAFAVGLVVLFAAGAWILLYRNRAWLIGISLFILLAVSATFLLPGTRGYALLPRLSTLFSEQIIASRSFQWREGLNVALAYPLLGSGPETLRLAFRPYKSVDYIRYEAGYSTPLYSNLDRAHNEWIDVAAARGGIGLLLFLVFLAAFFLLWGSYRRQAHDRATKGLLAMLLAAWVTYLAANLFNFGMAGTTPFFWILTGCVGSFAFIYPRPMPPLKVGRPVVTSRPRFVLPHLGKGWFWPSFLLLALLVFVLGAFTTYRAGLVLSADWSYGQSLASRTSGDKEQGVKLALQAAQLNPAEGFYRLALGISQIDLALSRTDTVTRARELQQSRQALQESIPLVDQPETAWTNIAISFWQEAACYGNLENNSLSPESRALLNKARESFLVCLDFDRTLPPVWTMLSQVELTLGNLTAAQQAAQSALALNPNRPETFIALARSQIALGDATSARDALEKALDLAPKNAEAKQLLAGLSP